MRYWIIIAALLGLMQGNAQNVLPAPDRKFLLEKEYEFWKAQTDSERLIVITQKAFFYRQQKKYPEAVHEIERGSAYANDSSMSSVLWKYEALINYYLSDELEKAAGILLRLTPQQAQVLNKEREYFYMRWSTFAETHRFQQCKEEMMQFCTAQEDSFLLAGVRPLQVEVKEKSERKARLLSATLPGLGAAYAGYPFKGFTSLIINGSIIGLTTFLISQQLYVTALVSGLLPLVKFYTGNIKLAEHLAEKKTRERDLILRQQYVQKIEQVIFRTKE